MSNDAFYVYGIVKFGTNLTWQEIGITEKNVYMLSEGNFSALVHDCEEKPYPTNDPNQIKEMIITHNKILNKAMGDFGGVIPLSFNTIIKKGPDSAYVNLKTWLNNDQEKLERIWNKIKGKKEYGLRIYYEKDKLVQEASAHKEVERIEKTSKTKGPGLSYLLQSKSKAKIQEVFHEKVNKLKKEFYEEIRKITVEAVVNPSQISLEEEKEVLLKLSVLIEEKQVDKIKEFLENGAEDFPYHLTGPFAPYSFIESG